MLKLAITLLAAALCSAPTAKAAESAAEKQDTPSFSQSLKKAYYDPAETYGTESGRLYVYTEDTLYGVGSAYSPDTNSPITNQATFTYGYNSGRNLNFRPAGGSEGSAYTMFWNGTETAKKYDIYLDGYYAYTAPKPAGGPSIPDYVYSIADTYTNMGQYTSISYIWIFDHQEQPDPAEEIPQDIFEAVGDTIEGLSTALTSPWEGLLNIFYDTTEQELTPFGEVSLIVAGTTLVFFLFGLVIALFRQRK